MATRVPSVITLLTDYGAGDDFVGICHGVIARLAPAARVIDLAHGIPPGDVAAGAHVLRRGLRHLPPGVHVGVVDPGVGSERRAVAVDLGDGERFLVGPDNGLLAPAIERFGGMVSAVDLAASPFNLEGAGGTFDGRDVFAPAAAALARGEELGALGEALDPAQLAGSPLPACEVSEGSLATRALMADRFGNVCLGATAADLERAGIEGEAIEVRVRSGARTARCVRAFADVEVGELLLHTDSFGSLELAARDSSAARVLDLEAGDPVELRAPPGAS